MDKEGLRGNVKLLLCSRHGDRHLPEHVIDALHRAQHGREHNLGRELAFRT